MDIDEPRHETSITAEQRAERNDRHALWLTMPPREFVAFVGDAQKRSDDAVAEVLVFGTDGRPKESIEQCLELVDVQNATTQALVGWLVASLSIADCSEVRARFYEQAHTRLVETEGERAERLVKGLGAEGASGARWGLDVLARAEGEALRATNRSTKPQQSGNPGGLERLVEKLAIAIRDAYSGGSECATESDMRRARKDARTVLAELAKMGAETIPCDDDTAEEVANDCARKGGCNKATVYDIVAVRHALQWAHARATPILAAKDAEIERLRAEVTTTGERTRT